ncbi:MAG: NUDIX hydrolase [Betaproteobacteria bacterium]|jgi:8-oxo-dGTP pyrophosphatase MutT (NUDIX family)
MVIRLTDLMPRVAVLGTELPIVGEDTNSLAGILLKCGDEYLICKTSKHMQEAKDEKEEWTIPMGHIKESEEPMEAAIRECMEEVRIMVGVGEGVKRPELLKQFKCEGKACYIYKAEIDEKVDVTPSIFDFSECKWVKHNKLPKETHPTIKEAIKYCYETHKAKSKGQAY